MVLVPQSHPHYMKPSGQFGIADFAADSFMQNIRDSLTFAIAPELRPDFKLTDFSNKQQGALPNTTLTWFNGKWGHEHPGTGTRTTLGDMDDLIPLNNITILVGYEKSDGTLRAHGTFGSNGLTNTQFCNLNAPWSDGVVYWEFGGNVPGTSDCRTSTHGTGAAIQSGDNNWAVTSGHRGMEIWQNGILLANHSGSASRVANAANTFQLGHHNGSGSDLAHYRYLMVFNRVLSINEIEFMGRTPLAIFQPRIMTSTSTNSEFDREESDLFEVVDSATHIAERPRTIAQSLGITDDVTNTGDRNISISHDLSLASNFVKNISVNRNVVSTLSIAQLITDTDPVDTLIAFAQQVVPLNVIADRQVPSNELLLVQTVDTGLFKFVEDDLALVQTLEVIGPIVISIEHKMGLQQYLSHCLGAWGRWIEHDLDLSGDLARRAFEYSLSDTITFVQDGGPTQPLVHEINFQQDVSAGRGISASNTLALTHVMATSNLLNRTIAHDSMIVQAAAYYVEGPCTDKTYNKYEGTGSAAGIPDKALTFDSDFVLETLSGPKVKLALRNPETDDRHRIGYTRVNRESRGGELAVFSDSAWPSVETLIFTIVALADGKYANCPDKINSLLTFFQTNLGKEIMLHDWQGLSWRGIITTPNEVATEDRDGWWTMTFEFEGIQLDGSQGDQELAITQTLGMNADWNRSLSSTLGITDSHEISGLLFADVSHTLTLDDDVSSEKQTPIMSELFDGVGIGLHDTAPAVGASLWACHENYKDNGTQSSAINSGAYYPFAPSQGTIYHVEWEVRALSPSDGLETTFFLGEGLNADANSTGSTAYGAIDPTTLKAGFVMRDLSATQFNACRLGDNTSGEADTANFSDGTLRAEPLEIDLRLVLDTRLGAGNWKATWYAKDILDSDWTEVRSEADLFSEDITMVGWAHNNTTTTVDLDRMSITEKVFV